VWAPPCTSGSLPRHPKLRSKEFGIGFDLLQSQTLAGNFHQSQSLVLAWAQESVGHLHFGKTSASNLLRYTPAWRGATARGCTTIEFDWCRYGRAYQKMTTLLRAPMAVWVDELGWLCECALRPARTLGGQEMR
jgi:hypothetical protein